MNNKEQDAITLLSEMVQWWDKWTNSSEPTEMEDPPIEEARALLAELQG